MNFIKQNKYLKLSTAVSEMPFLMTIEEMDTDQRYGFLARESVLRKIFFHVTKRITGKSGYTILAKGDKVLCQIGSTADEPHKRSAVIWTPLSDWDWLNYKMPVKQETLDLIRIKVLQGFDLTEINNIITAKWYKEQWNNEYNETTPCDLSDHILKKIWLERLSSLSSDDLEAFNLPAKLINSPFDFTEKLDTKSSNFSLPLLLSTFSPVQLSKIHEPKEEWLESSEYMDKSKPVCQKLSDTEKVDILEWFLEYYHDDTTNNIFSTVLSGTREYEAIFAKRLFARNNPLSDYLRNWVRTLIANDWLQAEELDILVNTDPVLAASVFSSLTLHAKHALYALWKENNASLDEAISMNNPNCSISLLLSTFSPAQLAQVYTPQKKWLESSEYMDKSKPVCQKLSDADKVDILEWFLEYYHNDTTNNIFSTVLNGNREYQAIFARRLFERNNPLPDYLRPWLRSLIANNWLKVGELDILVELDPVLATSIFTLLTLPAQKKLRISWKNNRAPLNDEIAINPTFCNDIIQGMALSIDLETDGEKIWEIGIANHNNCICLHNAAQGTDLQKALKNLLVQIDKAEIIVGHNILAWDWQILSNMVPDLPGALIWDTLLVQFLLNPQGKSHALGSNHQAEFDAKVAFNLFINQLEILNQPLKTKILLGDIRFSAALIPAITSVLPENLTYARPAPTFLKGAEPGIPVLVRSEIISETNWVPNIQITQVNPDESLDPAYWQIDIERLRNELTRDLYHISNTMVLLAICDRAKQQGITIRRNMIPHWIYDGFPLLVTAINQSCIMPTNTEMVHVAPLPTSRSWWTNTAITRHRVVLPSINPLIINRWTLNNEEALHLGTAPNTALVSIPGHDGTRWALPDPAARVLDVNGGWRGFDVIPIPESFEIIKEQPNPPNIRPVLAMRKFSVLFPDSKAQGNYWINQIASLRAVHKGNVVSVFLLTSTTSRTMIEMVNTACAEINMAEIRPPHRSRREHLKRVLKQGGIIVDGINEWRNWKLIADDAGITLQPVVEALPLEEWYAISLSNNQIQDDAKNLVSLRISMVEILEEVRKLVESRLDPWLVETGLTKNTLPPIILDPRLETEAYDLRAWIDRKPITLQDWSVNHHQKLQNVFADFDIKREEAPSDFTAMEQFLITNWQPSDESGGNIVKGFKPTQKKAMEHICARTEDVMVTLPTGEGKSVLFQIPALCRGLRNRRLTLVISPLKALMLDQVNRLHDQGFEESVDYINNDRARLEQASVLQGVLDNRIVLLYIAPERLRNARFIDVLQRRIEADKGLEHVVFDEAHCINQWGYEFRPDYFHAFSYLINILRDGTLQDHTPFLLMSATLTGSDRRGIKEFLQRTVQEEAILPLTICPDPATQGSPLRSHIKVLTHAMRGNIFDTKLFEQAMEERFPDICNIIKQAQANTRATGQRSAVIIFVSRRAHADELAEKLTCATQCDVESYHAGLDAPTREDIYNQFRDGELDFLVATKAFGMGMDIPDIHWVVHLSPPGYLEDYLQEVGRIGRGVKEREKAGLDKLDAILMASPADFESIRSQRAQNEIQKPQINTIEEKILANSEIIEDQKIAIVPDYGYEPYKSFSERQANATRLRLALYWLEKAGHLTQLGMVTDVLKVRIVPSRLAQIADTDKIQGRVARAILNAVNENNATNEDDHTSEGNTINKNEGPKGLIGSFLRRILSVVGIQVKRTDSNNTDNNKADNDNTKTGNNTETTQNAQDMIINLSQIRRQCEIRNLDKTMSLIVELSTLGALELKWELEFAKRLLLEEGFDQICILMKMVEKSVHRLLGNLKKTGEFQFDPHQWFDDKPLKLVDTDKKPLSEHEQTNPDILLKRYRRAFINGFRTLARASGVKMKQVVQPDTNIIQWHARLAITDNRKAKKKCDTIIAQATSLVQLFILNNDANLKSIEVGILIQEMESAHPKKTFHTSDLELLLYLLASLSLVSALPDLLPRSYLLLLKDVKPGLGQHPELVNELENINELAHARIFAMEIFANLPEKARDRFIKGYFANTDVNELKDFLESQLGEIEDHNGGVSGIITQKRDQLRATSATKFFAKYDSTQEQAQEPAQWKAMQRPFKNHLLVNAGPGSGKTAVLIGHIIHLIREQHIKPSKIIVLAFNRAVVFEIRKRIQDLFQELGYAAYASRVRVFTFHALAMRSIYNSNNSHGKPIPDNLLSDFAQKLTSDATFRQDVADQCYSILIDEFQDMNDDVYSIIRSIQQGSEIQPGVMAIGDDDQDILRWSRNSGGIGNEAFAELYFQRFEEDFGGSGFSTLKLNVNFRSASDIVDKSQQVIQDFFNKNNRSRRLKENRLYAAKTAPEGKYERFDTQKWTWNQTLEHVTETSCKLLAENSKNPEEPDSIAILCRSNVEVANLYCALESTIPNLTIQNSENMSINTWRHVALWIDFLETEIEQQDQVLSDLLFDSLFKTFCAKNDIPEVRNSVAKDDFSALWSFCTQENAYPYLSTLIRFMKFLKSDEFGRMLGARKDINEAVVSTIHKIKGLEYDNVIIIPSQMNFNTRNNDIEADAAEEARLLYVAMTRAKSRLVYYIGKREHSWSTTPPQSFKGIREQGMILSGIPNEIFISLPMDSSSIQTYIKTQVTVGDKLELDGSGKILFHHSKFGKHKIGRISHNFGVGSSRSRLKVSAVIRYPLDEKYCKYPAPCVKEQGWGYIVLAEGMLR